MLKTTSGFSKNSLTLFLKSGGARVIAHVQVVNNTAYLLATYDKSEQKDISDKEIKYLLSLV